MKRRDFLKILSAAPAIAAVPVLAKTNAYTSGVQAVKNEYPKGWADALKYHVAKGS